MFKKRQGFKYTTIKYIKFIFYPLDTFHFYIGNFKPFKPIKYMKEFDFLPQTVLASRCRRPLIFKTINYNYSNIK